MSLITRCPACGTMFKVVPDQLRISEGWVRCGRCAEVFDANAHVQTTVVSAVPLQESGAGTEQLSPPPSEENCTPAIPAFLSSGAHDDASWRDSDEDVESAGSVAAPEPDFSPSPTEQEPVANVVLSQAKAEVLAEQPLLGAMGEASVPAQDLEGAHVEAELPAAPAARVDPAMRPVVAQRDDAEDALADGTVSLNEVSFVRAARRKAFWGQPWVRGVLVMAMLTALLGLLAQVGWRERDLIAAWQPRARPWLEMLCMHAGCQVGPLRQIEAVVIDGSSFSKTGGDVYQLGLALKNQAPLPLATPAFELTLTDAQDQPLLRRVLRPEDLRAPQTLEAHADWSATVPVAVAPGGGMAPVAGYRLLAFYP